MNCGAVAARASPRRGLPWSGRQSAFQESTRPTCSGLPTPSRRTFASALPASALCMSASLRHPGCARSHSPLEGMGSPSPRLLIKTRRSHTFRRRVNSGSLTKPLDHPGHGFLAGLRPLVLTRASCPGAGPLTPSADACTRDLSRSRWTILATASWRAPPAGALSGIRPWRRSAHTFRRRVYSSIVTVVSSPSSRARMSTSL